jgi:ABC-type siderophore export system fused ATPase/permease subunit
MTEELSQSERQVVEELNAYLVKSATSAAELAFGVGCTLGLIVILLLLTIVYFAITKTWTVVIVTGFIAVLIGVIISSMLAIRAKNATVEKTYQRTTRPEIERFIRANGMSEEEFSELAANVLPASAPLREFWSQEHPAEWSEE